MEEQRQLRREEERRQVRAEVEALQATRNRSGAADAELRARADSPYLLRTALVGSSKPVERLGTCVRMAATICWCTCDRWLAELCW